MKPGLKQKLLKYLPLLAIAILIPVIAGARKTHADPIEFYGAANCLYEVTDQACALADEGYDGGVVLKDGSDPVLFETNLYLISDIEYDGKTYQLTMIGNNAFQGNHDFNYVRIPESVKYIGNYAFADTYLGKYDDVETSYKTGLILPDSIRFLGTCAFNNCPYLKRIHCASTALSPNGIGYGAMGMANDPAAVAGHPVEDFRVYAVKDSALWDYAQQHNISCGQVVTDIYVLSEDFDVEGKPQVGTKIVDPSFKVFSDGLEPEDALDAWNGQDQQIVWDHDYIGWFDEDMIHYAAGKTFPVGNSYLLCGFKTKDPKNSMFSLATAKIHCGAGEMTPSDNLEWNVGNVYGYYTYNLTGIHIKNTTITIKDMVYTGNTVKPVIVVKYLGKTLKQGTDYTISYPKAVNTGTYSIKITGKGKFYGSVTRTFKISAKKIKPIIKLSGTKYSYNGKVKKPVITVMDKTKKIGAANYTVAFSSKSPKAVGTYKITVKLKGNYSGSGTASYVIVPQPTYFTKISRTRTSCTLGWKRVSAQTTGYQVQYSTDKTFKKNVKSYLMNDTKKISRYFGGLRRRTTYYVRVRAYKKIGSNYYCAVWSNVKNFTTR
jgi:hypothetical protein